MSTWKSPRKLLVVALAAIGLLALALPAIAGARDRNHDRIPDRWERNHNLSLKVNQARRDQDRDTLGNRREFKANTDPRDADTDDDGVEDADEGAGTIASFDGTTLVINAFDGTTLTGTVDATTEITCEARDTNGDGDSFDEQDEGDDSPGEDSSGDDDLGEIDDDDQGEDLDDDADQVPCTTADLLAGTTVHEAEVENGVFTNVELVKPSL